MTYTREQFETMTPIGVHCRRCSASEGEPCVSGRDRFPYDGFFHVVRRKSFTRVRDSALRFFDEMERGKRKRLAAGKI